MKITISKSELQNKLKLVGRFIAPNKVNQQYENFLFELKDGILQVSAADEGGWMKTTIDHNSDCEDVLFSVDAKTLLDGIAQLSEQPIVISLTDKNTYYNLTIDYAGGHFSMSAGKTRIFESSTTEVAGEQKVYISSLNLLYGIKRTYFRAANDELRPVMNGVYIDQSEESFSFVATDGHTLAIMEYFGKTQDDNARSGVILHKKLCKILVDAITPEDEKMMYVVRGNSVIFHHSNFIVSYRMIEGRFPNYRAVIPKENKKIASIERANFMALLKRIIVFCNKNSNLIKLTFSDDTLQGNAVDLDYSMSADETMPIEYSDAHISIGFNGEFFLDLISNMQSCDKIKFLMADPSRAAIITEDDPTDTEQLTYIIMPMQINY